jgi:hypothetical protein
MNAATALALPPAVRRYSSPQERIKARIQLSDFTFYQGKPCWIWQGQCNIDGYGTLQMRVPGFRTPRKVLVHRFSISVFHGIALPDIDYAMHLCNIKRCCCPEHLKNGTNSENQKYMHETRNLPFDRHGNPIELDRVDWSEDRSLTVVEREPGCDDA